MINKIKSTTLQHYNPKIITKEAVAKRIYIRKLFIKQLVDISTDIVAPPYVGSDLCV
jgi:hypothetical protein